MPLANDQYIEDEINLRDYWCVLVRRRVFILGIVGVAVLATAILMFFQSNVYQSKATLLPLGKAAQSVRGMLGELGNFFPFAALGQESPSERILAILYSRTLAEDVIQRLDLLPRLFAKKWDTTQQQWRTNKPPTVPDAVRSLGDLVTITSDRKTGVITIAVEQTDPQLAATIANQYIEALQRILNDNAFSLAKKNRLFIESQVQKTRQELTVAEEALRQFEQQHKIIALDAQATAAVQAIASLEAEIMAKEVQLRVWQRSVTGASREVTLLQEELQGLQAQLARLHRGSPVSPSASPNRDRNAQAFPAIEEAPEIKLQYVRLQREATIQNKLFTLLMQEFEQAKLEEARDETAFQLLDEAIPPDKKIKPKRLQGVILATFVGAFLGVVLAFFFEYLDPTIRTREQVERQIGMPVLATVPTPVKSQGHRWQQPAHVLEVDLRLPQSSGSPAVEALRYLHMRLRRLNSERGIKTVLLTSAGPNEDMTRVLVNLAIVAAGAGEKTLLIDGNVREPTLHGLLHCPLAPGLVNILIDLEEWQKAIQTTTIGNLHLLPTGKVSPATCTPLELSAFDALLARCKERYDLILFAAPPILGLSDAAMLSSKVDATCLGIIVGTTRIDVAAEAKATLEAVQANIVGAVLVGSKA